MKHQVTVVFEIEAQDEHTARVAMDRALVFLQVDDYVIVEVESEMA